MSPSTLLGVMFFLFCVLFQASRATKCDSTDLQEVQHKCLVYDEVVSRARDERDMVGLCTAVFNMLKCAAANVSQCFDVVYNTYEIYYHSEYNCQPSQHQTLHLQDILEEAERKAQSPDSETTPTSGQNTTSSGGEGDSHTYRPGGGLGTPEITDNHTKKDGPKGGTKEEHTGSDSDGANTHSMSTLVTSIPLVVATWSLSWRLVS